MPLAYTPPGVTVSELTTTTVAPLLALPGAICLIGLASGSITRTDTIQLNGTTGVVLPGVPTNATMTSGSIVSVMDVINPSVAPNGFSSSTDYTFTPSTYTIVRVVTSTTTSGSTAQGATSVTLASGPVPVAGQVIRLTSGGTTETVVVASVSGQVLTLATGTQNSYSTASPVTWGNIPDGDEVYVTYTYAPSDYFLPVRLNNMTDIQNRFGQAWDPTGTTINSPLSFAASIAFQNGATTQVLQPLYNVSGAGVRQQPNSTQAAAPGVWSAVLNNLQGLEDINIVIPVIGQSQTNVTDAVQLQIFETIQDFIYQEKHGEGQYFVGVFGEDSSLSSSVAQESTLLSHATVLKNRYGGDITEQSVLLNTSQFSVANSTSSLLIGGQYTAAAIGGMLAARSPAATLTRQAVAGLLSVTDQRSLAQKNNDAANGLMVIETKGNVVQVRHGLTLDMSSVLTRELNVVRGKHYVVQTVSQTLESQVIGQIVADAAAPTLVNNLIIATLEDLRSGGIISDYDAVASQILSIDPTSMAVQFSYLPVFVINYVTIVFSLDLTNQTISNVATLSTSNG